MIKLYYKNGCNYCEATKASLNRYGIKYTNVNLSEKSNSEERKRFREMGVKYLPIIILDNGKIITDCTEEAILDLIKFGDL